VTEWREPKVLTLYVVGADGKRDRSVPSVIDGTSRNVSGPDVVSRFDRIVNLGFTDDDRSDAEFERSSLRRGACCLNSSARRWNADNSSCEHRANESFARVARCLGAAS
jgi:hypothetical protein